MLAGFAKVFGAVAGCAIAFSVFGVIIGAMAENYLLWIGISAMVGAGFGLALGYGLLPES
jgi:hypothetical protein